jgi:muramidase (phage lysozyme)
MTMRRADLRAALAHPNVRACLHMIRVGEGTTGEQGYRTLFGGALFDSFDDHPNVLVKASGYSSTAAGAGQFLHRTWERLQTAYGFPDFSPACQDEAMVALIHERGALQLVQSGRIAEAIKLINKEWASLPGSPYGQPTRTLTWALKSYTDAGGQLAPTAAPPQEKPVLPFVAAALPALLEAAPALIRIFGHSPQAEKNAKAAEVVAEIARQATGEATVEGAVAAIQGDPAKAAAYREAVHLSMSELVAISVQMSEAEDKSRDKALDRNLQLAQASGGRWLWLLGAVAVTVVIASYAITALVLFGPNVTLSDETKALLIGQIVIFGFATVLGFLFGSNIQNRVREDRQQS